MTNRPFDPEHPPVGDHRRRLYLLERLVDHVIEGWAYINANETESPVFMLRLDESVRPYGDRAAYIIYVSQGEWAPSPDAPLIRRVRWRRKADQILCQHGSVIWPDLDDELFRLDRANMGELETLADTLGHTLATLEDRGQWSLFLRHVYEMPSSEVMEVDPAAEISLPLVWRTVDYGDVKLNFMGGHAQKASDAAFVRLWVFLETMCTDDRRVDYPVVYHDLSPEVFAAALRHAAGLQLDR